MVFVILVSRVAFGLALSKPDDNTLVRGYLTWLAETNAKWVILAIVIAIVFLVRFILDFIKINLHLSPGVSPIMIELSFDPL